MYQLVIIAIVAVVVLLAWALRGNPPPPTSVEPAVIAAFRQIYRQQMLMAVLVAPFLVWVFHSPSSAGGLHGPLLMVAGIVVIWVCVHTYRYWRCPKCGAYLGRNPTYHWQCPSCGTALREPRESS
ncbi:MAG: hypothetical protein ABI247_10750 [Rhodanobacter sp.]